MFKKRDLKSSNKSIYKIRLDGEQESKGRRVFRKIFKLDENNQYGFAMTKTFPIETFKKEKEAKMEILNEAIENFHSNAKVVKIFVVDIKVDAYNDSRKSFYNEIYPYIFEPKRKVPVDNRSAYQFLSTMTIGKRGDVLKFSSIKKTHATRKPKKSFPM